MFITTTLMRGNTTFPTINGELLLAGCSQVFLMISKVATLTYITYV